MYPWITWGPSAEKKNAPGGQTPTQHEVGPVAAKEQRHEPAQLLRNLEIAGERLHTTSVLNVATSGTDKMVGNGKEETKQLKISRNLEKHISTSCKGSESRHSYTHSGEHTQTSKEIYQLSRLEKRTPGGHHASHQTSPHIPK